MFVNPQSEKLSGPMALCRKARPDSSLTLLDRPADFRVCEGVARCGEGAESGVVAKGSAWPERLPEGVTEPVGQGGTVDSVDAGSSSRELRASGADAAAIPEHAHVGRRDLLVVGSVLAVSGAVVSWLLLGQMSEPNRSNPDYLVTPPHVPMALQVLAGVAAGVSLVATAGWSWRRGLATQRVWLRFVATSVAPGLSVGVGVRIVTAAVSGANIGGALLLFGAPTILTTLALMSITAGHWVLLGHRPPAHGRSPTAQVK